MNKLTEANSDSIADKVMSGMRIAIRKLVETAAAKGESLVVGEKDGSFRSVPATDLLKKLQQGNK